MSGLRPRFHTRLPRGGVPSGAETTVRILHAPGIGLGGVWPTENPHTLTPQQLAKMQNLFTYGGALQTYPGDVQKGTTQTAQSVVGGFQILTGGNVSDNVYITTLDVFRWNSATDNWVAEYEELAETDAPTAAEPAGTGASTASSTTVTGIGGTTWTSRESWTRRSGSLPQSGDEFYVTGEAANRRTIAPGGVAAGVLTLTVAYPNTQADVNYTIRKHFRGATNDFFSAVEFQGKVYFCQGIDELKEWDPGQGTNLRIRSVLNVDSLGAPANVNSVPSGACLETFGNRIVMARLNSYAPAPSFLNQRFAWCMEGNQYRWDPVSDVGAGNRAIIETPGSIQWLKRMDQVMVIYKEFDIWFAITTGRATPAFEVEPKITAPRFGCLAPRSVVQIDASRHLYLGQEDICMLVPFHSRPIGHSAIRDFLYDQLDRENIVRAQAFSFDTLRKVGWLVPLGNDANAIILYDTRSDTFEGPIFPGSARKVYWIGNFVTPVGDVTTIDELIGTIDQQTWLLGTASLGAAARDIIYGSSTGRIDRVDIGATTFGGEVRTAIMQTAAVSTHASLVESVSVRVTLVYRHPRSLVPSTASVQLSADNFKTALGTSARVLNAVSTGKIEKAYFDFIVAAERVQAQLTYSIGTVEILEFGIEATRTGVEARIA